MNDIAQAAANAMPQLSHLQCMTCGHRRRVGDVGARLRNGWPSCCGYTMRLLTQREVDAQA